MAFFLFFNLKIFTLVLFFVSFCRVYTDQKNRPDKKLSNFSKKQKEVFFFLCTDKYPHEKKTTRRRRRQITKRIKKEEVLNYYCTGT